MNNQPENDLIVVGIGASAGGLEALESVFDQMPDNGGMAYVIVQHLSPDFKSLMVELMGRHTRMAIHRVKDSMVVEPDSLYLIPPKQDMVIKDGRLLLTERESPKSLALPIDHFFHSLAADKGSNSVGIILSGTGSDGSSGIEHVHAAGGLVIVQSPDSAKFDGMPRSAIETGCVDATVDPEKIPDLLHQYLVHRDRVILRNEILPLNESAMEQIFRSLQQRHRVDFSQYRPTTIGRRIERRIEMDSSIGSIKEYADLIASDTVELDQLHADLLIGVTNFFRDGEPFDTLKVNALKKLLAEHPAHEEFRVWVAACATGEEAYSIAILIDECLRESQRQLEVKVFATDIHRKAINKATTGIYAEELLKGVSQERKSRYFSKVESGYQINPDIRRTVVFAPHNLVSDPPFTRLSLVTCRNFLIYLLPKTQTKVISHFHFGLKKGGYLLLGSSETPGQLSNEFEVVDAHNRLYVKTRDARLGGPLFTNSLAQTSLAVNRYLPVNTSSRERLREERLILSSDEVLANLVPPGIVVDHLGRVLQVFQNAGKYLRVSDGLLSSNLMDMVDDDLRLAIGGAIQRSTKRGEPVLYERLQIKAGEAGSHQVRLTVTPLPKGDTPRKFVITFEQLQEDTNEDLLARQTSRIDLDEVSKKHLEDLEQELRHNREILQATTEEMETSNEELQATNEELVASNEELQSANEELHSVNEELFTVNGEYQRKISELTELTLDFDNLLESTEIHTLFLDKTLCIRKFTPLMADVLHLVPHDLGRRIDAFVHNINAENLSDKISQVLETGEPWEEQVQAGKETEFLLRLLPYRAATESSGVILTLIDISKLAAAQAEATLERERFERAIEANRDGTWDWPDLTKSEMWWSPTCYQILGYEPDEFPSLHSEWMRLIHPDDRAKIEATSIPGSDKCYVEVHENFDYRMLHKSGEYRWYCHRAIVDFDQNGKAVRMTGSIADIQDRKASEVLANEGIRLRDNFLSMLSHELRNPMGAVMNALTNLDCDSETDSELEASDELAVIRRQTQQMARLLDDLLDVARFGRDKIEFRKEIVDLCGLVDSVIESVDYQLEEKKQILKTSICEGPLHIIGDPSRIGQSQTNLIVNASKFSEPDQRISYSIQRENKEAVITVTDEGAGISPDLLESVFGLFVQSEDTLERSAGGMGVGLSLTQKIIHAHNGTVTAASDGVGHGSQFQIRLPLTTIQHEKREPTKSKSLDRSLTCKVLLIEDNVDAREMIAKTFRRRGFEVLAVGDGKVAINKFPEFGPRVAVVDIGLPGVSGYDVARTIRQNPLWNNVMLVALTGYGRKEDKAAIFDAGFNHHIVKPLIFDNLHDLILEHLSANASNR
jgi:two-component system CheB/CheR fusion protein